MMTRLGLGEATFAPLPAADLALLVAIVLPALLGLLGAWLQPRRLVMVLLAALPALAAGVVLMLAYIDYGLLRWQLEWGGLFFQLRIGGPSILLLTLTQLLGLTAALYTPGLLSRGDGYMRRMGRYLWLLMGLLLSALSLIWVAADLLMLYFALELVSLTAVAMLLLPGKTKALVAGMRYLLLALVGSLAYLLGVALVLGQWGTLDLAKLAQVVEPGPVVWVAAALLGAGLALKAALFPLHAWLEPVHASAWTPVSALHAALVIKASLFILLQLWLVLVPDALFLSRLVGLLGVIAVVWGGLLAWRAVELKSLVAFSTVAQLGYLMLVFPLLLDTSLPALAKTQAWEGFWLQLGGHALAKTAMFMAAGNLVLATGETTLAGLAGTSRRMPLSLLTFGVASVTLIGLPPSAGFTAKWLLLQAMLDQQLWLPIAALLTGTLLTATYIFRVFRYSFDETAPQQQYRPLAPGMDVLALLPALAGLGLGLFAHAPLVLLQGGGQ
ncbi:proton-conducting transporter membrane subunit [Halomonas sp. Bachu 37]|uniref:complex I subunit 5 family protein n=1 Tax=Halomonas kashgarensis TaxID=3084920 RepID=UPI00321779CB